MPPAEIDAYYILQNPVDCRPPSGTTRIGGEREDEMGRGAMEDGERNGRRGLGGGAVGRRGRMSGSVPWKRTEEEGKGEERDEGKDEEDRREEKQATW